MMFHNYDDFPFGVSFSNVPERFRDLTQRIPSIDDRDDLAGFTKLRYMNQVL